MPPPRRQNGPPEEFIGSGLIEVFRSPRPDGEQDVVVLDGRPRLIWATVTAHATGNAYGFARLDDGNASSYPTMSEAPEQGDGTDVAAYEVSGRSDVPIGVKVQLTPREFGPGYTFAYQAPAPLEVAPDQPGAGDTTYNFYQTTPHTTATPLYQLVVRTDGTIAQIFYPAGMADGFLQEFVTSPAANTYLIRVGGPSAAQYVGDEFVTDGSGRLTEYQQEFVLYNGATTEELFQTRSSPGADEFVIITGAEDGDTGYEQDFVTDGSGNVTEYHEFVTLEGATPYEDEFVVVGGQTTWKPTGNADFSGLTGTGLSGRSRGTVAATGTNQGTAAALAFTNNKVTGADGTKGVVLTDTADLVVVWNTDPTNDLKVYPPAGHEIADEGVNAFVLVGVSSVFTFYAVDADRWSYHGGTVTTA